MKIAIKNFQKKIPVYPKKIKELILKALSQEGRKNSGLITVCFLGDEKMRVLNFKYLHKNAPTDVLSFDLSIPKKQGSICADIVVSTDAASQNAKKFKTTTSYELRLYVIHGLLHLLGYDDRTPRERILMRKKENQYAHT